MCLETTAQMSKLLGLVKSQVHNRNFAEKESSDKKHVLKANPEWESMPSLRVCRLIIYLHPSHKARPCVVLLT